METEKIEEISSEQEQMVQKESGFGKKILELLIYAALIFVCVWVVPRYVVQRTVVSGESMMDTLHDEESLLVDKISYRFSDPERYDIVVFYPMGRDVEEYYVKRIYGLPG
ncbi:MAG: signal peptidase I, partial [Eubacterium sp.]|nr:signal peptidase I [Eubacterium sp.]